MSLGLIDLVLVGGASLLLYRTAHRRPPRRAEAGMQRWRATTAVALVPAQVRAPAEASNLVRAIVDTRRNDRDFFPEAVERAAAECVRLVYTALVMRDAGNIRARLTPEMYAVLKAQAAGLKAAHRFKHVERVEIAALRLAALWQDRGQDFATVHVVSRLIDYTTDGAGTVVMGSKTTPASVPRSWTFTRPIGPHAWRLAAIEER